MNHKHVMVCDGRPQEEACVSATRLHVDFGRKILIDQLYRGYGDAGYTSSRLKTLRAFFKMFSWALIVNGTKFLKRALDIVVSLLALLFLSPFLLLLFALVRLQDGGPALFWQTRVGLWGREFRFPKIRSMVQDADRQKHTLAEANQHGNEGITFKMKRDPRVTSIGRMMRKLSLDELPQLWCVLQGDMSLVGPRPPVPSEVVRYSVSDRRRLEVKPGLTCIWQVSGRSELPFEQQVRLDAQYIDSHSLRLDMMLLLKTIPAILTGRGAY
ncbi:MAG: sugar transferase [Edaphobacter sp.]|uniref:sugar transferase n=1 Tax=Edaphobacter sp. TaxID=1934404 RepID=UPI0023840FEC|nr:sugar transferase [Edaphobacter sp.]MDE1175189.1 sugar transferase [Edaphobacter sp.]